MGGNTMLLLTYRNWYGPGRSWPKDKEFAGGHDQIVGMVSRDELWEAIAKVKNYSNALARKHNDRYASDYKLLSVSEIAPLMNEHIEAAGLIYIDNLQQTAEELKWSPENGRATCREK